MDTYEHLDPAARPAAAAGPSNAQWDAFYGALGRSTDPELVKARGKLSMPELCALFNLSAASLR